MNYTVEIYAAAGKTKEAVKEALNYCESDGSKIFSSFDFMARKDAVAYCKELRKHYTGKPYYECNYNCYTVYHVIVTKMDEDGNVKRIY